jgi:hypothetical protein
MGRLEVSLAVMPFRVTFERERVIGADMVLLGQAEGVQRRAPRSGQPVQEVAS